MFSRINDRKMRKFYGYSRKIIMERAFWDVLKWDEAVASPASLPVPVSKSSLHETQRVIWVLAI